LDKNAHKPSKMKSNFKNTQNIIYLYKKNRKSWKNSNINLKNISKTLATNKILKIPCSAKPSLLFWMYLYLRGLINGHDLFLFFRFEMVVSFKKIKNQLLNSFSRLFNAVIFYGFCFKCFCIFVKKHLMYFFFILLTFQN
jgi:hypothetical protein